jgi:anthranilate synthase component II
LRKFQVLKLLIINNYDSFVYNLVQMVEQHGINDYVLKKNDDLDSSGEHNFDKVLISPGPGIAKEAGQLMDFIVNNYQSKSILGICLGYEALAENFGSKIIPLSKPMHGVRNKLSVSGNHYIFKGLPKNFMIGHYHSWALDEKTFPPVLQSIAKDEIGMMMAFHHTEYDLTGLMFHPESIMTEYGFEMLGNWLEHY